MTIIDPSTQALDMAIVGTDVLYLALERIVFPMLALAANPPGDDTAVFSIDEGLRKVYNKANKNGWPNKIALSDLPLGLAKGKCSTGRGRRTRQLDTLIDLALFAAIKGVPTSQRAAPWGVK
ncbi:hypothetical protein H257_12834 [Aphanomyces astaci]|uniref:Uncharacterized protein n=1 Tax=Aphanomyces astaci TaxID=112090 RepID=W4FYI3_APHAT|nr:hypothetical protein H257_12834 [Aphanomyces astaci]ETV72031.1 hypothetical protein H257_12834 [Aphanomyces astaci]|eukprot:XP_009838474.1 hypothetical protein H257_12834 [Aphanomyces astaci]